MEKVAAVKIIYGDDIRRFSLSSSSYDGLRSIVLEAFPELNDTREWKLKYKDEEGDFITITCDFELAEALHQPLLRIYVISEGPKSQTVEKEAELPAQGYKPAAPSAEPPKPQPNPIELVSILSEALSQSFSAPTQPSSQPTESETSATAPPFDPKLFLPIFNHLQQNSQQSMNTFSQLLNMAPQLLADPAFRNALPSTLNALQQNPALIQALPQLLNMVSNNPALLNMLPMLLSAFAPAQQQQPQQQPQQPFCPQFSTSSPMYSYTYQPQQPQQPQQMQPEQPQQEQPPQYRPQQWTFSPSPAWKPAEFQPQPDAWPFKLFQPNLQQQQPQQQQQQQPSQPTESFAPPTFSFTPQHGASPSFTFGHSPVASSSLPEFEVELQQLEAMGFTNVEANKALLRKNNGDMVATVQDLTGAGLV